MNKKEYFKIASEIALNLSNITNKSYYDAMIIAELLFAGIIEACEESGIKNPEDIIELKNFLYQDALFRIDVKNKVDAKDSEGLKTH